MIGGAPAAPLSQEEFASNGMPRMTGVPGLAVVGSDGIESPVFSNGIEQYAPVVAKTRAFVRNPGLNRTQSPDHPLS